MADQISLKESKAILGLAERLTGLLKETNNEEEVRSEEEEEVRSEDEEEVKSEDEDEGMCTKVIRAEDEDEENVLECPICYDVCRPPRYLIFIYVRKENVLMFNSLPILVIIIKIIFITGSLDVRTVT